MFRETALKVFFWQLLDMSLGKSIKVWALLDMLLEDLSCEGLLGFS